MRAREFLLEAKPESLGQGMLDKLFATYQSKPDVREFNFAQPIEVANEIFRHVGPNYLIWASKQYTQDRYFFLHDLPAWQETLAQFADLSKDRRIQIERDINRYQNIDQLRDVINNLTQKKTELGSKFYSKAISAIDSFVKNGQATWLYRSNEYSIYHPKTFEASNLCAKLLSTTVCTIMNKEHFEEYSEYGTLMYIITQDKLYNCYISKIPEYQESEFADEQNNHTYDLTWMLNQFPALGPLVKKAIGPDTELTVKLESGVDITEDEWLEHISDNPFSIGLIENPSDKMKLAAVKQNGSAIRFIKNPSEEMQLAAVKQNGYAIGFIENPSEAVQLAAVKQNGYAIQFIKNPSEAVQLAAVKQNGSAIYFIKKPK